jgi:peptidoglycan hydrolase-like protein with peptidoglycan-binding domain
MPTTIQLGSTGDDVKRLQRVFARSVQIGLNDPITGVFDASLDLVVRDFQSANGLTVDGIVGPHTWAALPAYREASPTVQSGANGPVVGRLQLVLSGRQPDGTPLVADWAPYTAVIDGRFGPLTDASVRSFQSSRGLTVDGIVGDQTWFGLMTPGTMQHLMLEQVAGLLEGLPATL